MSEVQLRLHRLALAWAPQLYRCQRGVRWQSRSHDARPAPRAPCLPSMLHPFCSSSFHMSHANKNVGVSEVAQEPIRQSQFRQELDKAEPDTHIVASHSPSKQLDSHLRTQLDNAEPDKNMSTSQFPTNQLDKAILEHNSTKRNPTKTFPFPNCPPTNSTKPS